MNRTHYKVKYNTLTKLYFFKPLLLLFLLLLVLHMENLFFKCISSLFLQIFNRGASRINEVRLDINVPVAYEEAKFATITLQVRKESTKKRSKKQKGRQ